VYWKLSSDEPKQWKVRMFWKKSCFSLNVTINPQESKSKIPVVLKIKTRIQVLCLKKKLTVMDTINSV
jgi:hypothetical protein